MPLASREPVEVHQARHVGATRPPCAACVAIVAQSVAPHLRRHVRLADGERAAEAAALVGTRQLGDLRPCTAPNSARTLSNGWTAQLARLCEPESAQPVAADVNGDALLEHRAPSDASRVDADLVVEERAQLGRPIRDALRLPIEPPCATTSPACSFTCTAQLPDSTMTARTSAYTSTNCVERRVSVPREARVRGRLAAARRALRDVDVDAEPLEHRAAPRWRRADRIGRRSRERTAQVFIRS